jgi:hypothetical protein
MTSRTRDASSILFNDARRGGTRRLGPPLLGNAPARHALFRGCGRCDEMLLRVFGWFGAAGATDTGAGRLLGIN